MSFKDYIKRSSNNLEILSKRLQEIENKNSYADERFWTPTKDKEGNASATIRFLPGHPEENNEFVRYFSHSFKVGNRWFIEKCPTSIGLKCPVCEANSELWNTELESNRKIVSDRKRKLSYISNIFVINDPGNPENNGKVFLFRYGKKIFDMIANKISPKFEDEDPFNPFDLVSGANFKLRMKQVAGYSNYDDSVFDIQKPLGTEKLMEEIWNKQYKLAEFVDPASFLSYDELLAKYNSLFEKSSSNIKKRLEEEEEVTEKEIPSRKPSSARAKKEDIFSESDEEEDPLAYFQKLANED